MGQFIINKQKFKPIKLFVTCGLNKSEANLLSNTGKRSTLPQRNISFTIKYAHFEEIQGRQFWNFMFYEKRFAGVPFLNPKRALMHFFEILFVLYINRISPKDM